MSKQDQPEELADVIRTQSGLRVYGELVDRLGNRVIVHESSVPEDEGGPFVWLTLQKAGETGGVGVLLDSALLEEVKALLDNVEWGVQG